MMISNPPRQGFLWRIWVFLGLSSPRWDQKLILLPEQYAYRSAGIKNGNFDDDVKKLF